MSAPPGQTSPARPMVGLTSAINYAISAKGVWSYHLFNICVHAAAGFVLFGVVRRTLLSPQLSGRFAEAAAPLALVCATIWVVHPLQTQAVTYTVQRAESMMGLFYLLTVYCAIRTLDSAPAKRWYIASVCACAAGMATKEVMVTAPVMVVLYDRTFALGSFSRAIRRRWRLYIALGATWMILVALAFTGPIGKSAGFGLKDFTPLQYAATQCEVVFHYLRMSVAPYGQVLDYHWPIASGFAEVAPWAIGLGLLMAVAVWALLKSAPAAGFCGVWFFVILSPTSSFMPIKDVIFEHRMYLSLAGVIAGIVCGSYASARALLLKLRVNRGGLLAAGGVAVALVCIAVGALGLMTIRRNYDYRSTTAIWRDTIAKQPKNHRAHNNFAIWLVDAHRLDEAIVHIKQAIPLRPAYLKDYRELAEFLVMADHYGPEIEPLFDTLGIIDRLGGLFIRRALMHKDAGRLDKATADCSNAIAIDPDEPMLYMFRGEIAYGRGDYENAIPDFSKAIELAPNSAGGYNSRGGAHAMTKDYRRAIRDLTRALELDPGHLLAKRNLAYVLAQVQNQATAASQPAP